MLIRFALVLVFACAVSQATDSPAAANTGGVALQQNRNWISQRGNVWVWNRDDNGNSLEMTVRGEVEFNDDYTEVKRITDGGSLEIAQGVTDLADERFVARSGSERSRRHQKCNDC